LHHPSGYFSYIACCEGIEAKPPGKTKELVDTERAQITEICKRQLHLRLQERKLKEEDQRTFGVLVGGK
jgi:hypothetical protein